MPTRKADKTSEPAGRKPVRRAAAQGKGCGGFAGHVKIMFVNGAALAPVAPVTPVAMGKSTRGVELESVDDLDTRQIAEWMKQAAAVPGVGGKKR